MAYKRIPPNGLLRLKNGSGVGLAVFLGAVGLASYLVTAISSTQTRVPWKFNGAIVFLCLLVGVGAAYLRGRSKLIPDSLVDQLFADGEYTCRPCNTHSLKAACDMTRPHYRHEYVSGDIAEQWRLKNPKAFMEIVNSDGEICAAFGVLSIKDDFMKQFIAGNISDKKLTADDIRTLAESKRASTLYLSGIVVKESGTFGGSMRTWVMTWAILAYLKKVYRLDRPRTVYAIAVTKESERMMKKLKFQLVRDGKNCEDKCNMYKYTVSKESWEELSRRIGNLSTLVDCKF